jgi:hypothetical protein
LIRPAYIAKTIALHSASIIARMPQFRGRALLSLTSPLAAVTISCVSWLYVKIQNVFLSVNMNNESVGASYQCVLC